MDNTQAQAILRAVLREIEQLARETDQPNPARPVVDVRHVEAVIAGLAGAYGVSLD